MHFCHCPRSKNFRQQNKEFNYILHDKALLVQGHANNSSRPKSNHVVISNKCPNISHILPEHKCRNKNTRIQKHIFTFQEMPQGIRFCNKFKGHILIPPILQTETDNVGYSRVCYTGSIYLHEQK
jgi:hypothetical protein